MKYLFQVALVLGSAVFSNGSLAQEPGGAPKIQPERFEVDFVLDAASGRSVGIKTGRIYIRDRGDGDREARNVFESYEIRVPFHGFKIDENPNLIALLIQEGLNTNRLKLRATKTWIANIKMVTEGAAYLSELTHRLLEMGLGRSRSVRVRYRVVSSSGSFPQQTRPRTWSPQHIGADFEVYGFTKAASELQQRLSSYTPVPEHRDSQAVPPHALALIEEAQANAKSVNAQTDVRFELNAERGLGGPGRATHFIVVQLGTVQTVDFFHNGGFNDLDFQRLAWAMRGKLEAGTWTRFEVVRALSALQESEHPRETIRRLLRTVGAACEGEFEGPFGT